MSTVAEALDGLTVPGSLVESLPGGDVRCLACGHRCLIHPGRRGICRVRFNQDGVLRVPWGYVAGLQCDPTEKKPFYHLLPGSEPRRCRQGSPSRRPARTSTNRAALRPISTFRTVGAPKTGATRTNVPFSSVWTASTGT